MEYVAYHGSFEDIPLEAILRAWKKAYGKARIDGWVTELEKSGGKSCRNFDTETILNA
jgi:hypothetical protein